MKKFLALMNVIILVVFITPSFAGPPTKPVEVMNTEVNPVPITTNDQIEVKVVDEPTTPRDVNVVNTPMVEVVNTEPMPTVVSNTSSNPIPVTINECNVSEIKNAYAEFSDDPQTVMTIASNKTFILTDIISQSGGFFSLFENAILKTKVRLVAWAGDGGPLLSIHFRTGIPFSSSSNIVIDGEPGKDITITGYLLDN